MKTNEIVVHSSEAMTDLVGILSEEQYVVTIVTVKEITNRGYRYTYTITYSKETR